MSIAPDVRARRLVFLCWALVATFYFYLSYDYIRVSWNGEKFGEYLTFVVQLAGNENRPPKEIRDLLLTKADELGFPLDRDQIKIVGNGSTLNVTIEYRVDVDIPVLRRGFYSKQFVQTAKFKRQG